MKPNMLQATISSKSTPAPAPVLSFNIRTRPPVVSNSSVTMGSNNSNVSSTVTTTINGNKLLDHEVKELRNDFNTFRNMYNEDRQANENHRREMYSNYVNILNLLNNMRNEEEERMKNFSKEMISSTNQSIANSNNRNSSNATVRSNSLEDISEDAIVLESVEYNKAVEIISKDFVKSLLESVSNEKCLLNKVL